MVSRLEGPEGPWRATGWEPVVPSLRGGLVETWTTRLWIEGPGGSAAEIPAMAQVQQGYPLSDAPYDPRPEEWWRLDCLPAGPFLGASQYLGEALCTHNLLVKTGRWLQRHAA
jgi:hypothetical protein